MLFNAVLRGSGPNRMARPAQRRRFSRSIGRHGRELRNFYFIGFAIEIDQSASLAVS